MHSRRRCDAETAPPAQEDRTRLHPRRPSHGGYDPCHSATADDRTFEALVEAHLPVMVRVARRFLKSDDLAWDAVQESLLAWWRTGMTATEPRAWLIRTVVHRCLHLHRSRRRRAAIEDRAARAAEITHRSEHPADRLDRKVVRVSLAEAVAQLPTDQRGVFVRRELDGMSYHAIGRELGIAVGTVRSRLFRARRSVRDALAAGLVT